MTTPTLISTETIAGRVFTVHRALFVTPRGGCGARVIRRIDRKTVAQAAWEAARAEAMREAEQDQLDDPNWVGSRWHY